MARELALLMDWFKNLDIRRKIILIFGAFLLLALCVAIFALASAGGGASRVARAGAGLAERLVFASDAAAGLQDIRTNYAAMCGTDSPEKAERHFALCGSSYNALLRVLDSWRENLESGALPDPVRRRQLETVDSIRAGLSVYMDCVIETYATLADDIDTLTEAPDTLTPRRWRGGREALARFAACAPSGERLVGLLIAADRGATQGPIDSIAAAASRNARRAARAVAIAAVLIVALSIGKDIVALRVLTLHFRSAGAVIDEADAAAPQAERPNATEPPAASVAIDKPKMLELIKKIKPMLEDGDLDSLELAGGLTQIPASKKLIAQIGDYDFGPALETLLEIKRELEAQA